MRWRTDPVHGLHCARGPIAAADSVKKFSVVAWHRFLLLADKGARRRPAMALLPAATEFGVGQTES